MRGKESAAVNIFWTITTGGIVPDQRIAAREANPIATAMGVFTRKKKMRLPKRIEVIDHSPSSP